MGGDESLALTALGELERISRTLALTDTLFPGTSESFEAGATKYWSEDE